MRVSWRLFVDCANEKSAHVLLGRAAEALGKPPEAEKVEPYHKGGFILVFSTPVTSISWSEAVVEVLAQAQQLGRAWQLCGSITEELDAWSTKTCIAGISSVHVQYRREQNA